MIHSEVSETFVLGAALIDPTAAERVAGELTPEHFAGKQRRNLFLLIRDTVEDGDGATVDVLMARGADAEWLAQLVDAVPTAAGLDSHLRLLRREAHRRRVAEIGRALTLDAESDDLDLGDLIRGTREKLDELSAPEDDAPHFRTLAELMERPELLAPPEKIARTAYRGRATALCGPDKSGKSTYTSHLIARLTRGHYFLGEPVNTHHHRAVLVGLEEALGDEVRRLAELGADPGRVQVLTLAGSDLLQRTDAVLAEWPADLVVVDSLSEYARVTHGEVPDNGDASGWAAVVRPLVALARKHDVALIILHHVRRSDGQYRGSSEIAAAVDAIFEMQMPERGEDPNTRKITGRGRWPIEPFMIALRGDRYELASGNDLSLDALVLIHVEQNPGCSLRDVLDNVPGRTTAISKAVKELEERGAIHDQSQTDRKCLHPGSPKEVAA